MTERISTESYIDRELDDRILCATMKLMYELKRSYVESSVGKDAYNFFETVSPFGYSHETSALFPVEETVASVEYHAASANIAAWISATSRYYLPDNIKVCGVDDKSVSISIISDLLADTMRLGVTYSLDDDLNVNPAVYLVEQGTRVKEIDQLRGVDLSEFDSRSVFGVDTIALKGQVALAFIETYLAWQSDSIDDKPTLLS